MIGQTPGGSCIQIEVKVAVRVPSALKTGPVLIADRPSAGHFAAGPSRVCRGQRCRSLRGRACPEGVCLCSLRCACVVESSQKARTMALNIRNKETERLAQAVIEITGETKTEAVTRALMDRLQRVRRDRAGRSLAEELDAIALRCAALPVRDPRSADEILGYDQHGVPR